jgi:Putative transposase DNA-binding domain
MPYRPEPDLYWLQVDKNSYPALAALLASRQVEDTSELFPGLQGVATWQVREATTVTALSDIHLHLGDTVLKAQLDHLPTHAYRGLIASSTCFSQYPRLNELHALFKDPRTPAQALITALEDTAAAGRQTNSTPQLVTVPRTFSATWVPERTLIRQLANQHFFIGLTFRASYTPAVQAPPQDKVDVGLDLGLFPRTVAYTSNGHVKAFWPTELRHVQPVGQPGVLTGQALHLLRQLLYATGRCDSEQIIRWVMHYARTVTSERLTHRGMSEGFIFRGRDCAVHDHHYAALSLYLNAADIPLIRVNPAGTSQDCGACLERTHHPVKGQRHGRHFYCPVCGWQGCAHTNAARVILQRGLQQQYGSSRPLVSAGTERRPRG